MPHMIIDKIKNLKYPFEINGYQFLFKAGELIAVKRDKTQFFLKITKRDNGYLLKYDKITRPIIGELKGAYLAFVKANEANILKENVLGIKEKVTNSNLLTIKDDLSEFDIVEVGFGSGRNLIHLAKKYPTKNFLGIEIHKPSIEQVLRRIDVEKIENIKIINHDARIILSKIPSNKLEQIIIHFPVPWDKKPHRRVINKDFINEAIRSLKVGGILHLRTDSENYFRYSLDQFLSFKHINIEVRKNVSYEVRSKYEDRWLKLNKDIFDIFMKNIEKSEELKEDFDFNFEKKLVNLDFTPKVIDNIVIHIEKIYPIDDEKELIRLTYGNVNRPEHLYIINSKVPEYFKLPAPTRDNYVAHLHLKRLFNG